MYLGKRLELALGLPFSNTPMTKQNWSESERQSLVSLQDILQGSNNEEKNPATPVGSFISLAKNWQTKMTDVNHLFKQTGGKKKFFYAAGAGLKTRAKDHSDPVKNRGGVDPRRSARPVPFATVRSTHHPNPSREKYSPSSLK